MHLDAVARATQRELVAGQEGGALHRAAGDPCPVFAAQILNLRRSLADVDPRVPSGDTLDRDDAGAARVGTELVRTLAQRREARRAAQGTKQQRWRREAHRGH